MAGQEQSETTGGAGTVAEGRCPASTFEDGRPCGRPLYHAPPGVDERPVCLMHSLDPQKSDAEFQKEFERIMRDAGEDRADLSCFVFPTSDYQGRKFDVRCSFKGAVFLQHANFRGATFCRNAFFRHATFTQGANFAEATFLQNSIFGYAATFKKFANFYRATFSRDAEFQLGRFQRTNFAEAKFKGSAYFDDCEFQEDAFFNGATFSSGASFRSAMFMGGAEFKEFTLAGRADFSQATFAAAGQFKQAKLVGGRDDYSRDGFNFSHARFRQPEKIEFYRIDLGGARFRGCEVSKISFSDVTWRKRSNGKSMVFDEEVCPEPRDYRLVAELYQQLKKYYDDRRDYWTAGDFHYGEMEVKRLASDHHSKALRWLHSNVGLVAWYKYASEYGESYVRPGCWPLAVLVLFSCLYPWAGLCNAQTGGVYPGHCEDKERCVSYANWKENGTTIPQRARAIGEVLGHGAMTALYVAAFQKDLTYRPSYPKGRLLALAEVLLTSTLGGLFLLAVRRQFRR